MSEKKKAPTAATADANAEITYPDKYEHLHGSIVPDSAQKCKRGVSHPLLEYIPTGRENAVPAKELARRAGYKDARSLQADIHNLRVNGALIFSTTEPPGGYYLSQDKQEAVCFVRSMEGRQKQIGRAIQAAKAYIVSLTNTEGR